MLARYSFSFVEEKYKVENIFLKLQWVSQETSDNTKLACAVSKWKSKQNVNGIFSDVNVEFTWKQI